MPELRKDPVVERWVIIATERARRPMDFAPEAVAPRGPEGCPFCPGHEDRTPPELFRSGGSEDGPWTVRVVPNKFPALHLGRRGAGGRGGDLRPDRRGRERTRSSSRAPDHFAGLGTLPAAHVGEVLVAYRERLLALRKDPRLEYVLIFKNHGVAAGASLEHPHSQLIATPILPELVAEELEGAVRYFRMKERCVWCDIVRQERRDGSPARPRGGGFRRRRALRLALPLRDFASCRPPTARASRASCRTRWTPWRVCSASWSAGSAGCSRDPAVQLRAPHRAPPGDGSRALPLAPRAHAEADAARRLRARHGLLHQPDAARGRRALPAPGGEIAGARHRP